VQEEKGRGVQTRWGEAVYCGVQKHADARSGASVRGDHDAVRVLACSPGLKMMSIMLSTV
jgi:hypothetical protein